MTRTQTSDPLPADAPRELTPETCRVCRAAEFRFTDGHLENHTRSITPGDGGRHTVQVHHDWCPVLTGETPEVACPQCGAPVFEYEYKPGYQIQVPGLNVSGQPITETYVFSGDDMPAGKMHLLAGPPRPAPFADKVTVQPCGDTIEGSDATQLRVRIAAVEMRRREREAEAEIAAHAELLSAAEAAGMGALADQFRAAVRAGSDERAGLLAALRTVTNR